MSSAAPKHSSAVQPNALGVAASLTAWLGAQIAAVGFFDWAFVHSATGDLFMQVGVAVCMVGTFVLGMQKLKRPVGAAKLWLVCIGLMPITMLILFIAWQITLAGERRENCANGDAVACHTLAQVLAKKGKNDEAIALYERGCELNDARSCRALGGQVQIMPTRVSGTALEFYLKACELGDGLGCDRAGNMLRESDPERAQQLFDRACNELDYVSSCSTYR